MALVHLARKIWPKIITNEILVRHIHFSKVYGNNLLNFSGILFFFFPSGTESWASFLGVQHCLGKFKGSEKSNWPLSLLWGIVSRFLLLSKFLALSLRHFLHVHTSRVHSTRGDRVMSLQWGFPSLVLNLVILPWRRFLVMSCKIMATSGWRELQNNP